MIQPSGATTFLVLKRLSSTGITILLANGVQRPYRLASHMFAAQIPERDRTAAMSTTIRRRRSN